MQRLFTFGCSMTKYFWMSWADIISEHFDYHENWGMPGSGNPLIFNSLVECHKRHQFNPDDTIVIMWTTPDREDSYWDRWVPSGNIYLNKHKEAQNSLRGYFVRDMPLVSAANIMLEGIGCNYIFTSLEGFNPVTPFCLPGENSQVQDVLDYYQHELDLLRPSVIKVLYHGEWENVLKNDENRVDLHPYPMEHLQYVEQVFPEYANVSDAMHDKLLQAQNAVEEYFKANRTEASNRTLESVLEQFTFDRL